MFFVYLLAALGLAVLLVLAASGLAYGLDEPDPDDPYEQALAAAARLQAGAWEAIHELREIGAAPPDSRDQQGGES